MADHTSKKEEFSAQIRETVEKKLEHEESGRQRVLASQRLDLARAGLAAAQKKQLTEAAQSFHAYLKILEDMKNVNEGGLLPVHFETVKEITELLMISGVYWDLAKMYDRTRSSQAQRNFLHYLEKYILFSKGMPFQALCAENLRRYIHNEKPVHMDNFKEAYRILTNGDAKCFVVSSLIDVVSQETPSRLRSYRDEVLLNHWIGKKGVQLYYRVGPTLAKMMDRLPKQARRQIGKLLDHLARKVS